MFNDYEELVVDVFQHLYLIIKYSRSLVRLIVQQDKIFLIHIKLVILFNSLINYISYSIIALC